MIVIAPWIRAYQGENYFGITGAQTPYCRSAPARPPPGVVDKESIRRNKAQQAAAPRDEVAHPCRPPFQGVRDESALATALRYRDDGPSAIQLSRRDVGPLSVES